MKRFNSGFLLIIIGVLLISIDYHTERRVIITNKNRVENTIQKELGYLVKDIDDTYNMIIDIPQIKLKRGIYDKNDKRNSIEENITIHNKSDYPTNPNSNLILMAHSGTGVKAHFKDLSKLTIDSLIKVYYQGLKYTYKINNYYEIEKNGYATIKRVKNKKTITLITCSQKDKSKQIIYIGYLIDEI